MFDTVIKQITKLMDTYMKQVNDLKEVLEKTNALLEKQTDVCERLIDVLEAEQKKIH